MVEVDCWLVGRGEPYWEERYLCRALAESGYRAEYLALPGARLPVERLVAQSGPTGGLVHVRPGAYTRLTEQQQAIFHDSLDAAEEHGLRLVNSAAAIRLARNTLRQAHRLAGAGLPVPVTCPVDSLADARQLVAEHGPCVVKPVYGNALLDAVTVGGAGGLDDREAVVLDRALARHGLLAAQRYLGDGPELRIAVLGGQVASCYQLVRGPGRLRRGLPDDQVHPWPLDDRLEDIARTATATLGLHYATLDVLVTDSGPALIEVSPSFAQWQRLTDLVGFDLTEQGIAARYRDQLIADLTAAEARAAEPAGGGRLVRLLHR